MLSHQEENYLSKEYQITGIKRLQHKILSKLDEYVISKKDPINKELKLSEIKSGFENITKKQCMFSLHNELKEISDLYLQKIQSGDAHDNRALLKYLNEIAGLLNTAEFIMEEYEKANNKSSFFKKSTLHSFLEEEINLCKESAIFLKQAVDINIYAVHIPEEEYKKIRDESKSFHYEGKLTATTKAVGGSLVTTGVAAAYALFSVPIVTLDIFLTKGAITKTTGKVLKGSTTTAKEGVARYGFGSKTDFPSSWIKGRLTKDDKADNNIITEQNSHYAPNTNSQLVYILDCRDPKEIYAHGTNYSLDEKSINPHGHVVFFHNLQDALTFSTQRMDGATFDNMGGWRLHNHWTEEERNDIRKGVQLRKIIEDKTHLPEAVSNVVTEYITPSKRTK